LFASWYKCYGCLKLRTMRKHLPSIPAVDLCLDMCVCSADSVIPLQSEAVLENNPSKSASSKDQVI